MTGPIPQCLADLLRYANGYVTIRCGTCKHESTVTVARMAQMVGRRGAGAPWKQMQARLVCRSCGARKQASAGFWEAL